MATSQRRGRRGEETTAKKRRVSAVTNNVVKFCFLFPAIYALLYTTGLFDSMLMKGADLSDSFDKASYFLDVALIVINTMCPFIGLIQWNNARELLED